MLRPLARLRIGELSTSSEFIHVKKSDVGAGEQGCSIPLGKGLWIIESMSAIPATSTHAQPCKLFHGQVKGDGTIIYHHLKAGYCTPQVPLCLENPRTVEAGFLHSIIDQASASDFHNLYIAVRRVKN